MAVEADVWLLIQVKQQRQNC